MEGAAHGILTLLDGVRARALRWTLQPALFRKAFRDRAARLSALFALSVLLYLPLSFWFPLWMLAIGPLVWGIAHIAASVRYQPYVSRGTDRLRSTLTFLFSLWAAMSLYRIYTDVIAHVPAWETRSGIVEAAFASAALLGTLWIHRATVSFGALLSAVFIAPVTWFLWHAPLATTGVLIIAHNFVAFFYWVAATRTRRDRAAALGSLAVFTILHALVWLKVFDPVICWRPETNLLSWSGLSIDDLGRTVAPWSTDSSFWYRCVVLYAFGQAIHYFVWLKAIPDLFAPSERPTSFRLSWDLLRRDFSPRATLGVCALAVVPLLCWGALGFDVAERLYFAFASFHGYLEIAGLGWVVARRLA
jgi:hypothetical protein